MPELSLGFSPCPNDTFLFHALANQKLETEGLRFKVIMADVEELNRMALEGKLDITKLSFHALAKSLDKYQLLRSGSALGRACGPILISKRKIELSEVPDLKVAIPGESTTAHFLFKLAFPSSTNVKEYFFADIEKAVQNEEVDLGLIIHENRFTYEKNGLLKVIDLGEFWDSKTSLPIPLGGICIRRSLAEDLKIKVNNLIHHSVQMAFDDPDSTMPYVKQFAQEMDQEVLKKHINLYVNNFSLDLGEEGLNAVEKLMKMALEQKIIAKLPKNIWI